MRAETIRRLLVFGVCALGVSALYLVPSLTHAPDQLAQPTRPDDAPTPFSVPSARITSASVSLAPTQQATSGHGRTLFSEAPTTSAALAPEPESSPSRLPMGTPIAPGPVRDSTPPEPVTAVRLDKATEETATLSWRRAADDVGVAAYRVWLNGYVVSTTTQTTATVRWFNDDAAQQIVQVRALDAAGNQSEQAASLLASRPTPSPTSEPTATATETPTPSASASAESAPEADARPNESLPETPR